MKNSPNKADTPPPEVTAIKALCAEMFDAWDRGEAYDPNIFMDELYKIEEWRVFVGGAISETMEENPHWDDRYSRVITSFVTIDDSPDSKLENDDPSSDFCFIECEALPVGRAKSALASFASVQTVACHDLSAVREILSADFSRVSARLPAENRARVEYIDDYAILEEFFADDGFSRLLLTAFILHDGQPLSKLNNDVFQWPHMGGNTVLIPCRVSFLGESPTDAMDQFNSELALHVTGYGAGSFDVKPLRLIEPLHAVANATAKAHRVAEVLQEVVNNVASKHASLTTDPLRLEGSITSDGRDIFRVNLYSEFGAAEWVYFNPNYSDEAWHLRRAIVNFLAETHEMSVTVRHLSED